MGNPSTIWAQLAMPNPPAGSLPFVLADGITIGTDVINLNYNATTLVLHATNGLEVIANDSQVGVASPVTINAAAGRFTIAAGTKVMVVNNSVIDADDLVFLQQRTLDATLGITVCVVGAVGQFTVTGTANATGNVIFDFVVVHST